MCILGKSGLYSAMLFFFFQLYHLVTFVVLGIETSHEIASLVSEHNLSRITENVHIHRTTEYEVTADHSATCTRIFNPYLHS